MTSRRFAANADPSPCSYARYRVHHELPLFACSAFREVIVLAQFTLSRAVPTVIAVSDIPIFNSPSAAVAKLRIMLGT